MGRAARRARYAAPALRRFGAIEALTLRNGCTATALPDRSSNWCGFGVKSKTR